MEEEYFVVDPVSRAVVPDAAAVVKRAGERPDVSVSTEFTKFQVEARTSPCSSMDDLAEQVLRMRSVVAEAAEHEGLRIVATGTAVVGDVVPPPIADIPRYRQTTRMYRALQDEQSISACHVHVHLPDRERALRVSNHLRPWLPILLSMTANSPYWAGRDTGYASWRTLAWSRWPVAGPPPFFSSLAHFDDLVGTLVAGGALMDERTIFWDVRPSAHLPTLEIRVADVAATAHQGVLFAALVRALVVVAGDAVDDGDNGPQISGDLLRAAYWRSARDGLEGSGIDLATGRLLPATTLVETLLAHVRPALSEAGDLELVATEWERLRADRCGAWRQRAAYAPRCRLTDVVDRLIEQTDPRAVPLAVL